MRICRESLRKTTLQRRFLAQLSLAAPRWPKPRRALLLSLTLRTSCHVYYGLGFLLTIPFGYYATRSFQKHRRLMRPIVAHFLYDAVLITIAVLVS